MAPRRHFPRAAVGAVVERAGVPGDVAAEQTAAGGAGALARDQRELGRGVGELVEIRNGADQGREPGGARSEPRGGGEVVLADELEGKVA